MRRIHFGIIALSVVFCTATSTPAQVNIGIGIGTPHVSIGINLGSYPELVPVPGYPVYYSPRVNANYFFYDGLYWVFSNDYWYASEWYDGPWWIVQPEYVPVYILRIPVRYYRNPPPYFSGWRRDAPPRWGHHWGPQWEQHRRGWDKWDRRHIPKRAPLPVYQREYTEHRYPRRIEQQQDLRRQHYRYEPRDKKVRQLRSPEGVTDRRDMRGEPRVKGQQRGFEPDRPRSPQPVPPERREREMRQQMEQPRVEQYERRERPAPRPQGQDMRPQKWDQEPQRQGQGHEQRREEERGRERGH